MPDEGYILCCISMCDGKNPETIQKSPWCCPSFFGNRIAMTFWSRHILLLLVKVVPLCLTLVSCCYQFLCVVGFVTTVDVSCPHATYLLAHATSNFKCFNTIVVESLLDVPVNPFHNYIY